MIEAATSPPLPCVYYIQQGTDGPIKIGIAISARFRLAELQIANPTELYLLGLTRTKNHYALERRLHKRLARHLIRGEWFWPSPVVLKVIAEHMDPPEPQPERPRTIEEIGDLMRQLVDGAA